MIRAYTTSKKALVLFIATLLVCTLFIQAFATPKAKAVSSSDWKPGRIIDDAVFFNKDAMNPQQIQAFLNSKVPVCDTWHNWSGTVNGVWNAPPYTCLKDFSENGKSAAQIIWEAGQYHGINPQVIIATLQKETSIVTDTWAAPWQYQRAMGYACPDTAACDAQYYGFTNQVHTAAWQFKRYTLYPDSYNFKSGVTRNIQWSTNINCGSSPVYIETQGTAALYNYTPYQPNNTALSNLYGSQTDGCSQYGNRNFWRIFNDWFGPTTYTSIEENSFYAKFPCNIPAFAQDKVGRLYNPGRKDYLYTTDHTEACLAVKSGYIWDGIQFNNTANQANSIPIYRLSNGRIHIYTSSILVKNDYIQSRGYYEQGIGFYAKSSQEQKDIGVYCLVKDNTVVYTSSSGEAYILESAGYSNLGLAFFTTSFSEESNIYRLKRGSQRLYTANDHERNVAQLFYGFTWENYDIQRSYNGPGEELTPVYRISTGNRYFYTTNRGERDIAVVYYGYLSEGVGFYAYPYKTPGNVPIFRASSPDANRLFTSNQYEINNAITKYGYSGEGVGWYSLNNLY